MDDLHQVERHLTRRVASCRHPLVRWARPVIGEAAEHTKLWWGVALALGAAGGWRGRKAAAAGLTAMGVAELLSNAVMQATVAAAPATRPSGNAAERKR